MDGRYSLFASILAIVSLAIAICMAIAALFSGPLGFLVSIIIMGLWGLFSQFLGIACEPEFLMTVDSSRIKKKAHKVVEPAPTNPRDWAQRLGNHLYKDIKVVPVTPKYSSRTLQDNQNQATSNSRILNNTHGGYQPKTSPDADERAENSANAEMHRAL